MACEELKMLTLYEWRKILDLVSKKPELFKTPMRKLNFSPAIQKSLTRYFRYKMNNNSPTHGDVILLFKNNDYRYIYGLAARGIEEVVGKAIRPLLETYPEVSNKEALEYLGFESRINNLLFGAGCLTVDDVAELMNDKEKVKHIRGFGEKSIKEVERKLRQERR